MVLWVVWRVCSDCGGSSGWVLALVLVSVSLVVCDSCPWPGVDGGTGIAVVVILVLVVVALLWLLLFLLCLSFCYLCSA